MTQRDEFNQTTKRIMAERVAWICSFPGCNGVTIGPKMGEHNKSLNLGEAAHIHAASPKGPRYDSNMSRAERKSISNGIWMCRHHAAFIDSDHKEYSAETLKLWKIQAEENSYKRLKYQEPYISIEDATLIAIGFDIIILCTWQEVHGLQWKFSIKKYLKGSIKELRDYSSNFDTIDKNKKFIVIESQGDARLIKSPIKILSDNNDVSFSIIVTEKVEPTDPKKIGVDLALSEDGDLVLEDGDIKTISGVDAAKQFLTIATSTIYGEWWADPNAGSFVSTYFNKYKDNPSLLAKLIKIEFIRLSLVPTITDTGELEPPNLDFVKRFNEVSIDSTRLNNSRLSVQVSLEWGNGENWDGTINIWIQET